MNIDKEIRELVDKLNNWTHLYDEGHPAISDEEWDNYYFQLVEWEQINGIQYEDSPTRKISYQAVNKLEKITHNHPMLSLAKTKNPDDVYSFVGNKIVATMLKMDGLTCSLKYVGGYLISAETRGNGLVGENVLHNILTIPNVPKRINYDEELIVDGEVICPTDVFQQKFANDFANPRNYAAGALRRLDGHENKDSGLKFICWDVIKGFGDKHSLTDRLTTAFSLGFETVPFITGSYELVTTFTILKEILINTAETQHYPIDGLVIKYDDIDYYQSLGATEHHFRGGLRFKFYDEEYETTLKDIEWTMGRTGVLTPVAIFEPVDDGESTIERASLHNISVMKRTFNSKLPWVNQKIRVAKMNQIIPQITWAEDWNEEDEFSMDYLEIPTVCPICGQGVSVVESEVSDTVTLVCDNPNCAGKLINRLDHYCGKKCFDIKGLSKATLEKLIDWGWIDKIADLYALKDHRAEWIDKSGFGTKSVDNILNAIENSKNCSLSTFLCSLGIPEIGSTVSKLLSTKFSSFEDFLLAVEDKDYNFYSIDTIGVEMNRYLKEFDYTEAKELYAYIHIASDIVAENTSSVLDGIKVAITGKLISFKNRDELRSKIENAGGKVVSSVTKATNILINNDNTSQSAKNISAQKYGIPIMTENEFCEKFFKENN